MPQTYRVLVSTDLGGDPDDIQSLIHLLHYSDILKLEGILSTAGPGSEPHVDKITYWVKRTDLNHLRTQGYTDLMSEEDVLSIVKQGAFKGRAPDSDGSTAGSRWLIERAHAPDPAGLNRPLWVLVWGSLTDVAQALYDDPTIAGKIRINAIGSSNTVNDPVSRDFIFDGMQDKWPDLWWIEDGILPRLSHDTFRGYYLGGDQTGEWGSKAFLDHHVRNHGTTCGGQYPEKMGDAFPVGEWPEGVLKEGDSPTFAYLLSPILGGVGYLDDPTSESWGGQFRRPDAHQYPNYYVDLDASAEECQATINRWRVAYLSDWAGRWKRYDVPE